MNPTTARDRAEELLATLQKRARELLDAEESLVKTLRTMAEEKRFTPAELQKRLEEFVGRVRATPIWERLQKGETLAALEDVRQNVERRVEESFQGLVEALRAATKSSVDGLSREVAALKQKVEALTNPAQKN